MIMPGADEPTAAELAERLRAAIATEPIGGLTITMSFGVAAAAPAPSSGKSLRPRRRRALPGQAGRPRRRPPRSGRDVETATPALAA